MATGESTSEISVIPETDAAYDGRQVLSANGQGLALLEFSLPFVITIGLNPGRSEM